MTIRPGSSWGRQRPLSAEVAVVDGDAELGRHVAAALRRGDRPSPVAVRSGDLARAMGGGGTGRVVLGALLVEAPIDAVRVTTAEGQVGWFCAHLVARRSWWRGEVVAAVNGGFIRGRDLAPRAHPNDGRVDIVRVDPSMPWRARRAAWLRASTGSHLPHPLISVTQASSSSLQFTAPLRLWLDGTPWTATTSVTLDVVPDAAVVLA
ncbi:MAG: hypothetical protein ACKOYG_04980 [Ilumatobacteraceae bacterium]